MKRMVYKYEYCECPNWFTRIIERKQCTDSTKCSAISGKVLMRNEGKLTSTGAVSASTGKYTGRSPKDKFIVKEASVADKIAWGAVNQPISEEHFNKLYTKVLEYLKEKEELFVFKGFAGADRNYRLPIQVINEYAWHNLFVHQLFIRPTEEELTTHESELQLFLHRISKSIQLLTVQTLKHSLWFHSKNVSY